MEAVIKYQNEGVELLGGRQTIKLSAQETAGNISVMLSVIPAGTGVPVHVHIKEDEMFQIIEGELELSVDGKKQVLKTGDLVFLPKNVPHGFTAIVETKMWVTFTPGGVEEMFKEMAQLPAGPPDRARMAAICVGYGVSFM